MQTPTKKLATHASISYENGRTSVMELQTHIEHGSYMFECLNIGDTVACILGPKYRPTCLQSSLGIVDSIG